MKIINRLLFISFCLFSFMHAKAAEPLFDQAVQLYQQGSYKQSLELFQQLDAEGKTASDLYFNMGNCYAKLNDVGHAVLYYERALKLNPGFKQAKENLEISRSYIAEPVIPTEKFFFVRFYDRWILPVGSGFWGFFSLISLSIAAILYYLKISRRNKPNPWYKTWVYLLGLSIITGIFSFLVYQSENFNQYAIYMDNEGVLRSAPSEKSEAIINLSPGLKCLKIDQIEDWVQVRLMDYQHGWVPASSMEGI